MQTSTMFSITCTPKHHAFNEGGDLWCFDYEFNDTESVKDEPLMPEATELINRLLKHKYGQDSSVDKIEVTFSNELLRDNC